MGTHEDSLLTVNPKGLTIETDGGNKVYDGTPLIESGTVINGLVNSESAYAIADGSQTNAGSTHNTYTIMWETALSGNYYVQNETLGILTVDKAPVTITTDSASKVYDSTPLTAGGYTVTGIAAGTPLLTHPIAIPAAPLVLIRCRLRLKEARQMREPV